VSERVGRHAAILAEVRLVSDVDAETERERVISLIVGLNAMLHRAGDAASVLLPVVDGVRKCGDGTFEDRLASRLLPDAPVRHLDLRRNYRRNHTWQCKKLRHVSLAGNRRPIPTDFLPAVQL